MERETAFERINCAIENYIFKAHRASKHEAYTLAVWHGRKAEGLLEALLILEEELDKGGK